MFSIADFRQIANCLCSSCVLAVLSMFSGSSLAIFFFAKCVKFSAIFASSTSTIQPCPQGFLVMCCGSILCLV